MRKHVLLVDGYNVIHCVPRFERVLDGQSLHRSREALLRYCGEWTHRRRDIDRCCVVFDGNDDVMPGRGTTVAGVRAIYSRSGESADDRIRTMLDKADRGDKYTVVSDDNTVRAHARFHHMEWISAADFCRLRTQRPGTAPGNDKHDDEPPLSPGDAAAITEELKKHYGIEG